MASAINYPTGNYGVAGNNTITGNYYQPPMTSSFVWVNSENEARNAYVAPGSTAFFMDRDKPKLYVKSSTMNGDVASMKFYKLVEEPDPIELSANIQNDSFVTTETFNKSIDELKQLINSKFGYRKGKENS